MKRLTVTAAQREAIENGAGASFNIISAGTQVTFECYKHENMHIISANGLLISTHRTLNTAIKHLRTRYNAHGKR